MRRIHPGATLSAFVVLCVAGVTVAAYSVTQARGGPQVFANSCSGCHGRALQGGLGPALAGPGFQAAWADTAALFSFVSRRMPLDGPGALSHEQYVNVVAHLLQESDASAGGQ